MESVFMSISVLKTAEEHCVKVHQRKQKQICRIIKHLRDQLPSEHSSNTLPSDALIDLLVTNALKDIDIEIGSDSYDWHPVIYQTLQAIANNIHQQAANFLQSNQIPHNECMTIWQIKAFTLRLLALVNEDTPYYRE
jgi:hypothetical protein